MKFMLAFDFFNIMCNKTVLASNNDTHAQTNDDKISTCEYSALSATEIREDEVDLYHLDRNELTELEERFCTAFSAYLDINSELYDSIILDKNNKKKSKVKEKAKQITLERIQEYLDRHSQSERNQKFAKMSLEPNKEICKLLKSRYSQVFDVIRSQNDAVKSFLDLIVKIKNLSERYLSSSEIITSYHDELVRNHDKDLGNKNRYANMIEKIDMHMHKRILKMLYVRNKFLNFFYTAEQINILTDFIYFFQGKIYIFVDSCRDYINKINTTQDIKELIKTIIQNTNEVIDQYIELNNNLSDLTFGDNNRKSQFTATIDEFTQRFIASGETIGEKDQLKPLQSDKAKPIKSYQTLPSSPSFNPSRQTDNTAASSSSLPYTISRRACTSVSSLCSCDLSRRRGRRGLNRFREHVPPRVNTIDEENLSSDEKKDDFDQYDSKKSSSSGIGDNIRSSQNEGISLLNENMLKSRDILLKEAKAKLEMYNSELIYLRKKHNDKNEERKEIHKHIEKTKTAIEEREQNNKILLENRRSSGTKSQEYNRDLRELKKRMKSEKLSKDQMDDQTKQLIDKYSKKYAELTNNISKGNDELTGFKNKLNNLNDMLRNIDKKLENIASEINDISNRHLETEKEIFTQQNLEISQNEEENGK